MANLARVRTVWSGSPIVGGGVSTWYFSEAHSGFLADINSFFTAIRTIMPLGLTWTTENTGDLVDVTTGALTGSWTDGSSSLITSTGNAEHAAGVGTRIRWSTTGITNKRRVRGSTFIVPLPASGYDPQGTIVTATLTALGTAATALFSGSDGNMRIWTRPVNGVGGAAHPVVGYSIPDRVSWLRSRRT